MEGNVCRCKHHKVLPIVIILIALSFILANLGVVSGMFVAWVWPILLIIAMVPKLRRCKCCAN